MKYLKIIVIALMFMFTATSCGENGGANNNDTEEAQKTDSNAAGKADKVSATNATSTANTTEYDKTYRTGISYRNRQLGKKHC